MKPFVLLQVRPENRASDNEYQSFLKFGGLDPERLKRYRIETGNIPNLNLNKYSGIIQGGGPYNLTDPDEKKSTAQKKCEAGLLDLYKRVVIEDFPFLGSCLISLLAKSQGALISRKYSEPVAALEVSLTPDGL